MRSCGVLSDGFKIPKYTSHLGIGLGITQYRLAKAIGAPPRRINEIVRGNRPVTADTALRIGKALDMTPKYWLNLQRMYDLDVARATTGVSAIERLVG